MIQAFLPNPGRLSELFFPGVTLYVLDNSRNAGNRATNYTVVAVERDGAPVMLHTHWCNEMAANLLTNHAVPELEQAHVLRREVKVGHSRFDFLLEDEHGEMFLEIKSCTLFGNGVAMFPDAITERGRRHLLELAALTESGQRCRVLFIVQTDQTRYFMPDYHTDLAFAQTMIDVHEKVHFMALPVSWSSDLHYRPGETLLTIPWEFIRQEARDQGAYLALFHIEKSNRISVGGLGEILFSPGYYVYVGSAMRALASRIARHRRRRKRMHWHIDYLRAEAEVVDILPIRASERQECTLAADLAGLMSRTIPGFGCGDCQCESHLFHTRENPLEQPAFHQWLQRWRMRPPE